jgi:hypothetical protein
VSIHEVDLTFVGVGAGVGVGVYDGRGLAAGESVWRPRRRAEFTALDVERRSTSPNRRTRCNTMPRRFGLPDRSATSSFSAAKGGATRWLVVLVVFSALILDCALAGGDDPPVCRLSALTLDCALADDDDPPVLASGVHVCGVHASAFLSHTWRSATTLRCTAGQTRTLVYTHHRSLRPVRGSRSDHGS